MNTNLNGKSRIKTLGSTRQPGLGDYRIRRERRGVPQGVRKSFAILFAIAGLGGAIYAIYELLPWTERHVPQLAGAAFAGGGLFSLIVGLKSLKDYSRSRSFPSTTGRLSKAEIVYSMSGEGGFVPDIEFEYKVNGTLYRSSQLRSAPFQVLKRGPKGVQSMIDRLRAAPALTVYYDPQAPSVAFLQHSLLGAMFPVLMGLLFIGVGSWVWIRSLME